jgi:hypothetical protein
MLFCRYLMMQQVRPSGYLRMMSHTHATDNINGWKHHGSAPERSKVALALYRADNEGWIAADEFTFLFSMICFKYEQSKR